MALTDTAIRKAKPGDKPRKLADERGLRRRNDSAASIALLTKIDGSTSRPIVRSALRLAPLLFARPGKLVRRRWSELDLDTGQGRYLVTKAAGDPKRSVNQVVPRPMNRRPTPGSVAIHLGDAASSPSFCRSLPTSTRR